MLFTILAMVFSETVCELSLTTCTFHNTTFWVCIPINLTVTPCTMCTHEQTFQNTHPHTHALTHALTAIQSTLSMLLYGCT